VGSSEDRPPSASLSLGSSEGAWKTYSGEAMKPIEAITLEEISTAQKRIANTVVRTPLVRLNVDDAPAEIYVKLENLQPIRSFKLRGMGNAILSAGQEQLARGVWTASAGNAAQGVAWHARRLGLSCTIVVPDSAVEAKLTAIRRLGGRIVKTTYDAWWQSFLTHEFPGQDGFFVHPFADAAVMAGNGTIGLEILEDLAGVDTVVIPYGGGGLACGIASAIRAVKPGTKVYACEVETAAPLAASLAAGSAQTIRRVPSFVDGIGGVSVTPEMWPLAQRLLDDSLVVSLDDIEAAIRLLVERNCVVAEGAGAASVAAALAGKAGKGKVVCVVSGGNIDAAKLAEILLLE
jgi:threonine dehydratase